VIRIYPNQAQLASDAAALFVETATRATESGGQFSAALAGGSTPRGLYQRLAAPETSDRLDWERVHLFFGDERCVPPEHPDSNYRMVREILLDQIPIPTGNVHRIEGEMPVEKAALQYEGILQDFFGIRQPAKPVFDLILLGMGEDGHTASLFPGSQAIEEEVRLTAAVTHHTPPAPLVDRVSLTFPVINAAQLVVLLAAGEEKAKRLKQALEPSEENTPMLPIQRVQPDPGKLVWLIDEAAAGQLDRGLIHS